MVRVLSGGWLSLRALLETRAPGVNKPWLIININESVYILSNIFLVAKINSPDAANQGCPEDPRGGGKGLTGILLSSHLVFF